MLILLLYVFTVCFITFHDKFLECRININLFGWSWILKLGGLLPSAQMRILQSLSLTLEKVINYTASALEADKDSLLDQTLAKLFWVLFSTRCQPWPTETWITANIKVLIWFLTAQGRISRMTIPSPSYIAWENSSLLKEFSVCSSPYLGTGPLPPASVERG